MTTTRYIVCRFAQVFGFFRKNIRMSDAASEMHLLKEAESYLGKAVWQEVENIEKLSIEYWNLRKLTKERDRVSVDLEKHLEILEKANQERASLLANSNEHHKDLAAERKVFIGTLERLARERDIIVARARDVRRLYEGIKAKKDVLIAEGRENSVELEKISKRLGELKADFAALKAQRQAIGEKIAEGEVKIDAIENMIATRKKERREKASGVFQHIGEANQHVSNLRAELGVLDTQMRQLYSEIGRYVSRNAARDPQCKNAARAHLGLVDVMGALRKSVYLNHKLADRG